MGILDITIPPPSWWQIIQMMFGKEFKDGDVLAACRGQ
jgi:hypothetical protein